MEFSWKGKKVVLQGDPSHSHKEITCRMFQNLVRGGDFEMERLVRE